ncbi:hypothetical protein ACVWWI_000655 [Bradyrhizobium sp. USDA 3686]
MADSLKLGTARSRIRIGEESNGFLRPTRPNKKRENNPMHSRHVVEIARIYFHQKGGSAQGRQPYCVFATLGGWALVMKEVASSMAGPSGVGTFSQNGTRMRVPAIGANATSMLRWAARYLITGRSGM